VEKTEYLNKKVVYGGKVISRAEMIKDLQETAKTIYPDNKHAQTQLVNWYLLGHNLELS